MPVRGGSFPVIALPHCPLPGVPGISRHRRRPAGILSQLINTKRQCGVGIRKFR